jgi:hypothetical protein
MRFKYFINDYKTNLAKNSWTSFVTRIFELTKSSHSVRGLGQWTRVLNKIQRARLKAQRNNSKGKSLLSAKEQLSGSGESAAVRVVKQDLIRFSNEPVGSDNDPAVERTVVTLSVFGSDGPASRQEKEVRLEGGILSR